MSLKTLIIDNYDSYTFNLLQLFSNDKNVVVIRNDQFSWKELKENVLPYFDNVIISPGPGRPERDSDFGVCTDLIQAQLDPNQSKYHLPIFGICLGHQGIGYLMGGKVNYAPRIMHGRMSLVYHVDSTITGDVLDGCESPFWAVRYHSLVLEMESFPKDLILTCYCYENDADVHALKNAKYLEDDNTDTLLNNTQQDSHHHFLKHENIDMDEEKKKNQLITVMGFQHRNLPLWGVQYHPESVSTEHGRKTIENFQKETLKWVQTHNRSSLPLNSTILSYNAAIPKTLKNEKTMTIKREPLQLFVKKYSSGYIDAEYLIEELLANSNNSDTGLPEQYIAWLDSSRKNCSYSKMSILSSQPAYSIRYSTLHKELRKRDRTGLETTCHLKTNLFDHVSEILSEYKDVKVHSIGEECSMELKFQGGLVGYFGYEMKRESLDGYVTPVQQLCPCQQHQHDSIAQYNNCCKCFEEPDAAFQFVDRFLVFDHTQQSIYICVLAASTALEEATSYITGQEQFISKTMATHFVKKFTSVTPTSSAHTSPSLSPTPVPALYQEQTFTPDTQHETYLNTINQCIDYIKEGESYEMCLTTRFRRTLPPHLTTSYKDPALWYLYTRHLRHNNPAPYSAMLMVPGGMGVLSSSPERFLSVSATGVAEMKPIKGTMGRVLHCVCPGPMTTTAVEKKKKNCCSDSEDESKREECEAIRCAADGARKQQLWQDVKERAENLMIVDLIRNDLSQVCEAKSVVVPKLMHVETYERVHHLVSTVRGQLRQEGGNVGAVEAVRKCFPPGSMTGAPKLRSVQLLDELERHGARGVYSGCLGYFSVNGAADFNVVIRTAVVTTKVETETTTEVSVGGGGAITFLSKPEEEWKETLLKTKSVGPSVKEFLEEL